MSKRPSALVDTRIIYCGDCLDQLQKLPDGCVDLIYIDPPFNSNRNYEVFWGETREKRAFEDRHASTQAYIDYMRPRCVELSRVYSPGAKWCVEKAWKRAASPFCPTTRPRHPEELGKLLDIFGGRQIGYDLRPGRYASTLSGCGGPST